MLLYARLERLATDKHSSLLEPYISYKEMKFCKYNSRDHIHKTSFSWKLKNEFNKLIVLHNTRLERFATDKHYSLLDPFVSYEENEVL